MFEFRILDILQSMVFSRLDAAEVKTPGFPLVGTRLRNLTSRFHLEEIERAKSFLITFSELLRRISSQANPPESVKRSLAVARSVTYCAGRGVNLGGLHSDFTSNFDERKSGELVREISTHEPFTRVSPPQERARIVTAAVKSFTKSLAILGELLPNVFDPSAQVSRDTRLKCALEGQKVALVNLATKLVAPPGPQTGLSDFVEFMGKVLPDFNTRKAGEASERPFEHDLEAISAYILKIPKITSAIRARLDSGVPPKTSLAVVLENVEGSNLNAKICNGTMKAREYANRRFNPTDFFLGLNGEVLKASRDAIESYLTQLDEISALISQSAPSGIH